MNTILGYAAQAADQPLASMNFNRRAPRKDDVVIKILFCGVCHSDLHTVRNDWGDTIYPIVPGHEIIGQVTAIGSAVSRYKPGDQVGVGCMVDSCQACPSCEQGHEQYCDEFPTLTYNAYDRQDQTVTFGGYSSEIIVSERFVLGLPDGLDLAGSAPLLCAGITTWSPLRHWKAGPGTRVAVIGLGGLGHMALKLARALEAEVTLFTRSPGKEEDARQLGADQVVLSTSETAMSSVHGHFDLIIDTVPYVHDINPYIHTLATGGTLVLVGYLGPLDPFLNSVPMVLGRKSVAGSLIGGVAETQELLDFCGKHGITSDIEVIKMQDINQAYERMLRSDVKYRFVIDMESLDSER